VTASSPSCPSIGPALRDRIRRGLDLIALGGGGLATLIGLPTLATNTTLRAVVTTLVTTAIAACGLFGLRGRASWTPIAYVVLLFSAHVIALASFGFLLGMGTVYILIAALAFTFLSRIWRWAVVLCASITPVVVGALFEAGVLHAPPVFDPGDSGAWGRLLFIGAAAMIGIALIIGSALRHLRAARRQIEVALHHQRESRLAREQIELELARAQRAGLIVELAAEVGGDIGAALAIVSSRAEALMQGLDGDARACLSDVIAASNAARSTMRSLTLFAPEEPAVESLSDASHAARTLSQMMRRAVPQRIELVFSIEDGAWIPLSAGDLLRILANLILNARDAITDTGSIGFLLRRAAGFVTIEVTDDGCGMDETTRAQLFHPFFTTKPLGRGTGLGLATTKILVERAGGEIEFVSEPGRGTTFTIRLPEAVDGQGGEGSSRNDRTTRSLSGSSRNAAPTTT
jgi:signal transduction histidine kinase